MFSILKSCFRKVMMCYWDSSFNTRAKYLKKQGAIIGDKTRIRSIASFGTEPYLITVGSDVLFGGEVIMTTHDGGVKVLNSLGMFAACNDKMGRISIGNNCFIGYRTIILPGVKIGDNCIIGAMSVVSKDVPSNSVAAGIPCKVICSIEEYYDNNMERGNFYQTSGMLPQEKKEFLIKNVK